MPLLSLDETVERIDAVTLDDLAGLVDELWSPDRLSAAGIGPDEERFDEALAAIGPALVETSVMAPASGSRSRAPRAGWARPCAAPSSPHPTWS